jgi:CubicO group peptidase (beta-lactamase class C family)
MKLYLFSCILIPALSFSQQMVNTADSVRLTRRIPGMVYAVFTSDSILEIGAVGYKKYRTKDSIHINDRFDIGTNTAAFTSYIAAMMVQAGKIKWNSKLLDIFPEFKKQTLPVYENITLSELLSNQTRLPPYSEIDDWYKIPMLEGTTMSAKRRKFTQYMLQQKPVYPTGQSDRKPFSISGYVVAASMLERVAGKKWENLVIEYLNTPLKISIRYSWPNLEDSTATYGHWFQSNYFHSEDPNTWLIPNTVLYPAHDINITLPDYITFLQENLRGLNGKKSRLGQKYCEYVHYGILDYSLGWNNGVLENNSFSFEEGISLLFNCRAEILREKDIGIIVMCNSGDRDGRAGVLNLTRILESYALSR